MLLSGTAPTFNAPRQESAHVITYLTSALCLLPEDDHTVKRPGFATGRVARERLLGVTTP
jgi:hypothetical protein